MTAALLDAVEIVKKALIDALGVDADEVIPHALLIDDLGMDSLGLVEVRMRLEKATTTFMPDIFLTWMVKRYLHKCQDYDCKFRLMASGKEKVQKLFPDVEIVSDDLWQIDGGLSLPVTVQMLTQYVAKKIGGA